MGFRLVEPDQRRRALLKGEGFPSGTSVLYSAPDGVLILPFFTLSHDKLTSRPHPCSYRAGVGSFLLTALLSFRVTAWHKECIS